MVKRVARPGATVAPAPAEIAPTWPRPPSTAPGSRLTAEPLSDPSTTSAPAATVVPPEKALLSPESVSVPVPCLVAVPVPVMTPEKMVLELSPPAVSVATPSITPPAPASEPID